MDFYYSVYSQKELLVRRYEGILDGEYISRVGWLDTKGRVNLVMPCGKVRRFWRRPWQMRSAQLLGSLQYLTPWRWQEFIEWARQPESGQCPSDEGIWLAHDRSHLAEGCICRASIRKSGLSVYGVICIGRFFMPHVADEDQWWPVEISELKRCERIIPVQMFLDMELQDELLKLVRGMPETMDEIRARMTVMSI